jgi:hypothetical protein
MWRVVADSAAALLLLLLLVTPGASQSLQFLSDARFALGAAAIGSSDPQFEWVVDFSGEVDLIDYAIGQVTVLAEYEAILGSEFRSFDINQNNYTLDVRVSAGRGDHGVAVEFHHVSRHLSDRAKRFSIDWNMLGAEYKFTTARRRTAVGLQGFLGAVVRKSYVDYRTQLGADGQFRAVIAERVAFIASGDITRFWVDQARFGRSGPWRGGAEAGVRIDGVGAAALELFVRAERRVDPDPLIPGTASWVLGGFRFVSR